VADNVATKEDIIAVREDIEVLRKLLTGNGDPPKGIILRLDRLEQEYQRAKENTGTVKQVILPVLSSFISGILGAIMVLLSAHIIIVR
jgi:hypothetical protein